jgi:hypothetical protein
MAFIYRRDHVSWENGHGSRRWPSQSTLITDNKLSDRASQWHYTSLRGELGKYAAALMRLLIHIQVLQKYS